MTTEPSLFISGGGRVFRHGREAELLEALARQDAATLLVPATRVDDLVLDRQGVLPDGFRFTAVALRQLCALLAPGLYKALADLAGSYPRPGALHGEYSVAEAVQVYNALLRRRFAVRVEGIRLVRQLDAKRIDGVLGERARWLDNRSFWLQVTAALEHEPVAHRLLEATVAGRRLALRFCSRTPAAAYPDGGSARTGYFFVNDEVGAVTARGSLLLYAPALRICALGPLLSGRTATVAREQARWELMIQAVLAARPDSQWVAAVLAAAAGRIIEIPADRAARRALIGKLVRRVRRQDVPAQLARRVVEAAVLGRGGNIGDPLPFFTQILPRTSIRVLDLYNSLAACAKSLHPAARERLERAAYALLRGSSTRGA